MENCELRIFGTEKNIYEIIDRLKVEYGDDNVIVSGFSRNTRPPREGDFRCYVVVRMRNDDK